MFDVACDDERDGGMPVAESACSTRKARRRDELQGARLPVPIPLRVAVVQPTVLLRIVTKAPIPANTSAALPGSGVAAALVTVRLS